MVCHPVLQYITHNAHVHAYAHTCMKCVHTHALHQIRYRFSNLYLVEFLFYENGDTKFQTHYLNTVVC